MSKSTPKTPTAPDSSNSSNSPDIVLQSLKSAYFILLKEEKIGHTPEVSAKIDKLEAAIMKMAGLTREDIMNYKLKEDIKTLSN